MTIDSIPSGPSRNRVQHLREKIRRAEVANRNDDGTIFSNGSAAIDSMLPANGYSRGTIIEWLSPGGSSASFLSLLAARNAATDGGAIVIVDPQNQFYPPAAKAIGINLGNLIVLRAPALLPKPNSESNAQLKGYSSQQFGSNRNKDFLWAIDQSLRCSAVAAVWGELPEFDTPQMETRWLRRFQLSAESSGCCGMFLRKLQYTGPLKRNSMPSSWAEIQWHIRPLPNVYETGDVRFVRAELVRCRGGTSGRKVNLEINTITGNVQTARSEYATGKDTATFSLSLASQLAHPKARRRAARA